MARTKSSNDPRGNFSRKDAKPNQHVAAGPSADPKEQKRLDRLPPNQAEAIKSQELGRGSAGREFKEHGSEPDKPIVEQRPPMPNESTRTDMDDHGHGGYRGKN